MARASGSSARRRRAAAAVAALAAMWAAMWAAGAGAQPLRDGDGSCTWFPPDNPLRRDVSGMPVHHDSDAIIAAIGASANLHPDFGDHWDYGAGNHVIYGIPITTVDTTKGDSFYAMDFVDYESESDPGPYPFPRDAKIEGSYPGCSIKRCGGDRHVLTVDEGTCRLYEAWQCYEPVVDKKWPPWVCSNGATFNLSSSKLPQRPLGWTSGDAAGLPIAAALVRVAEVKAGEVTHAIRFTSPNSRRAYAFPASHLAPSHSQTYSPWMGLIVRLKSSINCSTRLATRPGRIICAAMQKYGMIMADNGSPWYFQGEASLDWENDPDLGPKDDFQTEMKGFQGTDFEVVDTGDCLCLDSDCTACVPPPVPQIMVIKAGAPVVGDGGATLDAAYSKNVEAAISTQGLTATNKNGLTTFSPHTSLQLAEPPKGGGATSRVLMRFDGLGAYFTNAMSVSQVLLNLTFVNPGSDASATAWFVTQAWDGTLAAGQPLSGALGWAVRSKNTNPLKKAPLLWTKAGAWPATKVVANSFSFSIPSGNPSQVSLELPLDKVTSSWLTPGSAATNFGLLIKLDAGQAGPVTLLSSGNADAGSRPALQVTFTSSA